MAQHIPTKHLEQKAFRKIEEGVLHAFKRSYGMKTSMRYQYIGMQEGNEVYLTTRRIPAGIVWGSERGNIEVHFDPKEKRVVHVFLVA